MSNTKAKGLLAAGICGGFLLFAHAAGSWALEYDQLMPNRMPIPPSEQGLATERAEHFRNISPEDHTLEGAKFDSKGNLYFCDVTASKVLKLDPDGTLTVIAQFDDLNPSGLAFHPDGRLFVAGNADGISKGAIYAMQPDGSSRALVLAPEAGYIPNDLIINSNGTIYFTDFKGNMGEAKGGVYYIRSEGGKPELLMPNISNANGIALSPDEKTLWIGDYGRSILYRLILTGEGTFNRIHSTPVYYFTGRGPDSMEMDADGNLYVAIMSQGRTMVFNPAGIPIGQVLLPGREEGKNLYGASIAINPLNRELVLVARDTEGGGANLFKGQAYAKGLMPPSAAAK